MNKWLARTSGAGAALASLVWSGSAAAGTFTPEGIFQFDSRAAVTISFDAFPAQPGIANVTADDALEGKGYVRVDTTEAPITVPLTLTPENRAFRARLFARVNRVVADVVVSYPDAGAPGFSSRMFPTGVVTSDGWYEVTTGTISIEGTRNPTVSLSLYASGADVDAFEIVPEGEFRASRACSGVVDPVCLPGEFCAAGWCRNGEANVPPLPAAEFRESIARYLAGRIRAFFGGRLTRERTMPTALATIANMPKATNAWDYWNGFMTAIHQLHDWHTTTYGPVDVEGRGAFPICVVEGDADLSHDKWPKDPKYADVLVSHVGPEKNLGLKPGDRIVAINGVHPLAFVEGLEGVDWGNWRADDPEVHAEAAERLRFAVRRWAKDITIIRCDPVDKTCSGPETIAVTELEEETDDLLYPTCDHRPAYHLKENNPDPVRHNSFGRPRHGLLADSADGEDLYGMIWNDAYLQPGGTNRYKESIDEFRALAKGVIMDHRTGNGGTEPAAEYLTTLFRTPKKLGVSSGFNGTAGLFDPPFTKSDGLLIYEARQGGIDAFNVGSSNARTDLPVALLLARDGSASDWFPFGMKGEPNIRIFGRRSSGAFSSYLQFDYYGQLGFQLASGDFIRADGSTHLGEGVVPHEEIVPKQSDLLVGKDTVYERALAWVRSYLQGAAQ